MGIKWLVLLMMTASIVTGTAGCADRQFTYNQVYILSDSDLQKRKHDAMGGNAQAAFDVYLHYMMGKRQQESPETLYWLKKAVALGHPIAKQHLENWKNRNHRSSR